MSAAEGTGEQGSAEVLPDKPDALVEEINRTREELGNTVEALAAKVDVKARAQQKAAEVSGQLKSKLQDATQGLSGKAGQLGARSATGRPGPQPLRAPVRATQPGPQPGPPRPRPGPQPGPPRPRPGAPPGRPPRSRSSSGPGRPRPP